jgi:alkylation response protein AidB-like acyl-CoA dehydrogenase
MTATLGRESCATPPRSPLEMARSLRDTVRANARSAEQLRTLPPEVVDALWSSGLMQFMNPAEAGGLEPTLPETIDAWQELAWQDASVGWIGIANFPSAAFAAAYLPDEGFDEVFAAHGNRVTLGGQFAPNGRGTPAPGGYRVSGSWNFGSGTGHSEFVVGGFVPFEGEQPRMAENGLPEMLVAVFPRDEIDFRDGWHVTGLCATGSFDYEVHDVFVPGHRVYPLFTRKPQRGGPLFRLGIMPITAAGHAAWALGVSRSALDDVSRLALEKTRMGDPTTMANKPTFQRNLAHHEAMWRAARLLVLDACGRIGERVAAGEEVSVRMRADVRLAASYATEASREIVQFVHLAAGTTAIREGSRLERAFRDMYTGTQHAFIGEKVYIDVAKIELGLEQDNVAL